MTSGRYTFLIQSLALSVVLIALSTGLASVLGLEGAFPAILLAALIGLLCFVPTYYLMRWAVGQSGNALVLAVCLGLPVRFGIAFAGVWIADLGGLIETNAAILWVVVFYMAHLIHESILLGLKSRESETTLTNATLKEER